MEVLQQMRPFFILLCLVDAIKQKWDVQYLQLTTEVDKEFNIQKYLERVS